MTEALADFADLETFPAMCITAIAGATVENASAAFSVEDEGEILDIDDAADEPSIGLLTVPGGVIAVEYNGWEGSREPVLLAASTGTWAASVYWNVNRLVLASLAEANRVVAVLEQGVARGDENAPSPIVDELVTDLDFSVEGPWVANSALIARRYTGVEFTADDVLSIEEFMPILPALDDPLRDVAHDELWRLEAEGQLEDPELLAALLASGAEQRRSFALWAADSALVAANVDESVFAEALRQARTAPFVELPAATSRLIRRFQKEAHRADRLDPAGHEPSTRAATQRRAATEALRAAVSFPEPLDAAIAAAAAARLIFLPDTDGWHQRARAELRR